MMLDVDFLIPLAVILHCFELVGTWREYILALRPTNSGGGIDLVSSLNLPITFLLVVS